MSDFLSMDELSRLEQRKNLLPDAELSLFGGYADAERKMAGFNAEETDFPITAVVAEGRGLSALTHRDWLGSLMGLGIERSKIGDIIVSENGAVIMAHSDIAPYISQTLTSVGKCNVSAHEASLAEVNFGERSFCEKSGTVASLRLDSITALFAGKGRSGAAELIKAGRVYVNGISALKADVKINGGDVITVRGFGKAIVEVGGKSKKDRIFVTLKKYV